MVTHSTACATLIVFGIIAVLNARTNPLNRRTRRWYVIYPSENTDTRTTHNTRRTTVIMRVRRKCSRREQRRHFAYPFQVADDAMQMDVHKTL